MSRADAIEYAIGILCEEGAAASVFYGRPEAAPESARIVIVPCGFFDEGVYGTPSSLPPVPLSEIDGVPLLFGKPVIERRGSMLIVKADIVASAYFLLTRYEECIRRDVRDEHGRFPGREALPFRAGFLCRPVVDEYAELLRSWGRQSGVKIPERKRQFSVLLTHDVDSLGQARGLLPTLRSAAAVLLGRRPRRQALSDILVNIGLRKAPSDNLENVIELDRQLTDRFSKDRCRAIYFFMAGGNSSFDGAYHHEDEKFRFNLRMVFASGADVGLHSSYEAGMNYERVVSERRVLQSAMGFAIAKNRHHFLCWREPEDGEAIADAGISWDSTLGFADMAGFRLGVCRPIPLFDPLRECLMGIEEHPLIVMDCTIDRPRCMNLDEEAAFGLIKMLAEVTSKHRGEFVCLWHNNELIASGTSYHRHLYPRVLALLGDLLNKPDEHLEDHG
jgi:hypothetical protein